MNGQERIVEVLPYVSGKVSTFKERLGVLLRFKYPSMIGHLVLTSERVCWLSTFPSKKIREDRRGIISTKVRMDGFESYTVADLEQDLADPRNVCIRLEDVETVEAAGRDGFRLEIVAERAEAMHRYRLFHVGRTVSVSFGPRTPIPSKRPMHDWAEKIRATKGARAVVS